MIWFISLLVVAAIYSASAYLTYFEEWRKSVWYYPASVSISAISAVIWCSITRHIGDKNGIYVYSLIWDTIICCVFYFVPLLFFGVKLDKLSAIGLILMIAGLVLIKHAQN